jgi:sulfotransferase
MAANLDPPSSAEFAALPAMMPLLSITSPATIRKCASLTLLDSDVFICSYPKSGTTWMQHIVLSLLVLRHNVGDDDPGTTTTTTNQSQQTSFAHVSEFAPFFEIDAHWQDTEEGDGLISWIRQNHQSLGRRVFNTHLRFSMLPKKMRSTTGESSSTTKFIYMMRSPLDVCVSFYHHLSNQVEGGFTGSFEQFFDEWLDGTLPYGSWIDHIRSYEDAVLALSSSTCIATAGSTSSSSLSSSSVKLADGRHLLFISYEQMLDDLDGVVQTLIEFLHLPDVSDEQRAALLPTFSFAAMKADIDRFQPQSVHWQNNNFCFLRKGIVGDYQEFITEAQRARFLDRLEQSGLQRMGETCFHQQLREITQSYTTTLSVEKKES